MAQNLSVTGKVTDKMGEPVTGASVLVPGTPNGTVTGLDGNFTLGNVPANAGDALRYVLPANPAGYGDGWKFKVDRDYLLPIQTSMLERTGNAWKQNPGW